MSQSPEQLDPYHKWLGIPPEEQPPNHYRLLSIRLYESDLDVIANAADRQMGHVRTFQGGRYSALSQKLLNEIAAARVCLLNPNKKAEYDRQLRDRAMAAARPMLSQQLSRHSERVQPTDSRHAIARDPLKPLPTGPPMSAPPSGARATPGERISSPPPAASTTWSAPLSRTEASAIGSAPEPLAPLAAPSLFEENIQSVHLLPTIHKKEKMRLPRVLLVFQLLYSFCVSFFEVLSGLYALLTARRPQSPYMTLFALICLALLVVFLVIWATGEKPYFNPRVREDVFCGLKQGQSELALFELLGKPTRVTHGERVRFVRPRAMAPSFSIEENDSCNEIVYVYIGENKSDQIWVLLSSADRNVLATVYKYYLYDVGYVGPKDENCRSVDRSRIPEPENPEVRARKADLESDFAACGAMN